MAGQGKISARQKMINLMYLVFIAIMAMTVAPEVLSAFGLMEEKFEKANEVTTDMNAKLLANLKTKGKENPKEFAAAGVKAEQVSIASDKFYRFIEEQKKDIIRMGGYEVDEVTGRLPFEKMKKGDKLDEKWFTGDRLTKEGDKVINAIKQYKKEIKDILGVDQFYNKFIENFEKKFDISEVKDSEGVTKQWLDYHFKGFPSIASYTKLTAIQNDVKVTQADLNNLFLGNAAVEATSLDKYKAIVLADKSAFFAGEKFQGRVVIGKYANVPPTALEVNGKKYDVSKVIDSTGAARLDFNVGNVGEHTIEGKFTFLENGKELEIPIIDANYVVVPKPNSATISADKMNVVYRGVSNPMTISFAGVPDNKVKASASGLSGSNGKYVMKPQSGREVTINVTGTLDDGSPVRDSKLFRIKDLPKPLGSFNGQQGNAKLPRNNVEIGKISADFGDDFDFKLPLNVVSFTMKVPGKPSVNCTGNRLNSSAKSALRSARRGDLVQFINIKAKAQGSSIRIKTVTPVVIELAN
ncbi:MAG: gliding motility protein GldM [Winogradskyella sp.]|uniref:type IX secretion system motor protein PorM/GldM n=1 Tax=Winogradskyella sp. TaxID=1883156 RepID=UPI0017D33688|nr:gliding motility protein GldM [Winogradskyella sp.]MBT8244023.1 gliding motility protein GldM [Winogradskyella sp.]NNK23322.1 gliding motility protein GldM [Winogradskyella sp.]